MGYQLKNEKLAVHIAGVGEQYRGARFDWSGFITEVTLLEGKHSFCVPESPVPGKGTGGAGLCSEFGIDKPPGFSETPVGGQFPKLGVGLLTRLTDCEYRFFEEYPVSPFEVEVEEASLNLVRFRVQPEDCRGYAVRQFKTVAIEGDRLTVRYELHNVGKEPIYTEEYCHNFFGIDHRPVGPEYILKFPFEPAPWADREETMAGLVFGAGEVRWSRTPDKPFYFRLPGFDGRRNPWMWELLHLPSGAGVRELSQFPVSSAAVWGEGHVISPEMFIEVNLAPGERKTWERVYHFFTNYSKIL
ncbi:hypothetical protein V3851_13645 [Paenibacillus sp. M1]|uniref:DUF4432 family protein n=1 Tax=Paenibacillus haidiansis TaxID=1574488 RepID=A0ABU7VT30_9BACL